MRQFFGIILILLGAIFSFGCFALLVSASEAAHVIIAFVVFYCLPSRFGGLESSSLKANQSQTRHIMLRTIRSEIHPMAITAVHKEDVISHQQETCKIKDNRASELRTVIRGSKSTSIGIPSFLLSTRIVPGAQEERSIPRHFQRIIIAGRSKRTHRNLRRHNVQAVGPT